MPRVTVVIPTYNRSALLAEAIRSVQRQTYRDFEIVVVDDGSTDDTQQVLEAFPDVTNLRVQNGGLGRARNAGSRVGTGELLAFLDDDDLWRPEKLARQIPLFDDPTIGLVHAGGRAFSADGWESPPGSGFYGEHVGFHELLAYDVITIQTVVVRRTVFEAVGGFWPERHAEDWEFFLRVANGHRMLGLREDLVDVRVGNQGLSSKAHGMWKYQMRVLREAAALHPGCPRCAEILPTTKRTIRGYVFQSEKERAARLRADGRPIASFLARANGYRYDPRAALRLPGKALSRIR